jgi:hypothetical protein
MLATNGTFTAIVLLKIPPGMLDGVTERLSSMILSWIAYTCPSQRVGPVKVGENLNSPRRTPTQGASAVPQGKKGQKMVKKGEKG